MHLFRFLGESPVGKKDVSLRTASLFSNSSKTVLNRKHSWVSRKENLHLGRIRGVTFGSLWPWPCSEQPLALWSHSPLPSRHKGTQVSVLIPSPVTHLEPFWVPGTVLGASITEGGWGFPQGAYSPHGEVHVQIGCPEIDATWKDVQMASVDPEKAQPCHLRVGDRFKLYQWEGGR